MKDKIHPQYVECKVTCGCGETFMTRSTRPELNVEICSACHPLYTGKQKFVDTAGRVEKFQRRHAWDAASKGKVLEKEPAKRAPRKLEKVTVGIPHLRKRKELEEEEEAAAAKEKGARRGKKGGEAPPAAAESKGK